MKSFEAYMPAVLTEEQDKMVQFMKRKNEELGLNRMKI